MARSLAHIERITALDPLPGYDRVVYATVLGWKVIVKKDDFQVGDLAVYFECDSLLPKEEWCSFMEAKHYRVKIQKMCKVYSQGLLIPLHAFYKDEAPDWIKLAEEGDDVTEILGVKYYEPEDNVRKAEVNPNLKYNAMAARHKKLFQKKPIRWLMKREWGKKLLFFLLGKRKDKPLEFPSKFAFIHKTDEERVENMPWVLQDKQPWIKTTKVDGTSVTYILEKKAFGKYEFYICSRNRRILTPDQNCYHDENVYWEMAQKYAIEAKLKDILKAHPEWAYVCLQGEIAGPGVQKNPHGLKDVQLFGFNFIDSIKGRWNSVVARDYMAEYNIPWVPIIDTKYILPDDLEELKLSADGPCEVPGSSGLREGYVYRTYDGKQSFKNVSREYMMKH